MDQEIANLVTNMLNNKIQESKQWKKDIKMYTDQNSNDILPYENYVIMRYGIIDDDGNQELTEIYGPIMGESILWTINKILKDHPVAILTIGKLTNI